MDPGLEQLKHAFDRALEGISAEQLHWHPPGKWCASEVLEHLYLTYTGTIKGFENVMAAGKPLASAESLTHRVRKFVVVGCGYMPTGRIAPERTRPRGLDAEKVRNELGEKLRVMDAIITECEARFGRGVQLLDHLVLGPLTAAQWRKFHRVHGMHHQRQLVRLRQQAQA
jgi:hypothetical protein